jgi:hypothetical protein
MFGSAQVVHKAPVDILPDNVGFWDFPGGSENVF